MRRVLVLAAVAALAAGPALAQTITGAAYAAPTDRYGHGALGGGGEWAALILSLSDGTSRRFALPPTAVFEDTAPRLADLDGDGAAEVIVVESDVGQGARLSVWGPGGRLASTAPIGRRNRWLAPVGAADLDGDGRVEIAYVETPHLGRTLKVVRLQAGRLVPVAERAGLTNHRFGDPFIQGGIAPCRAGPTIVVADADWLHVRRLHLSGGRLVETEGGPYQGPESLSPEAACR